MVSRNTARGTQHETSCRSIRPVVGWIILLSGDSANAILPFVFFCEYTSLGIGKWLAVNGEAIYGTCYWTKSEQGRIRFTTMADPLYAIMLRWPGEHAVIKSLAQGAEGFGQAKNVSVAGCKGTLECVQDVEGLKVKMPAEQPCDYVFALKITGIEFL